LFGKGTIPPYSPSESLSLVKIPYEATCVDTANYRKQKGKQEGEERELRLQDRIFNR